MIGPSKALLHYKSPPLPHFPLFNWYSPEINLFQPTLDDSIKSNWILSIVDQFGRDQARKEMVSQVTRFYK